MKKSITTLTIIILSSLMIYAGDDSQYVIGEKVTIQSDVLDEERSFLVYLPQSYSTTEAAYPVIYILDGMAHFHHASGIVQYLSSRGLMPESIVVAIINVDRTRDFTPTNNPNFKNSGGSEKFLNFLADELIPFVNRNYRSQDYRTLIGHSFGGTFTTYTFLNSPDIFQSYIAISPYLHYENDLLVRESKTKLKSKYSREHAFFMTLGYEPRYFAALEEFQKNVDDKNPKKLSFKYVQMLEETHMTIPHRSIYQGFEFIYPDWEVGQETLKEGLDALDGHYKYLSKKYGYDMATPEAKINELGYHYINSFDMENAVLTFEENVKRFPKSANVYDSLGEAYEEQGDKEEAAENYTIAVELAQKNNHPFLKIYEENLARVQ